MYQSLEATLHDAFWDAEGPAMERHLIESFLKENPGKALEVGCGSGRLLLPLLEAGYDVDGLEPSAEMLDLLREKQGDLSPTLHQTGMESFQDDARYYAIFIPAFTLQLLSREDALRALANLHAHAEPSAGIYLTVFTPWAEIIGDLPEGKWYPDKDAKLDDGIKARCMTRHAIERLNQQLHREHRYSLQDSKGKILETHNSQQTLQWYGLHEITTLLAATGWEVKQTVIDLDTAEETQDAHILTLIATAK